MDEKNDGRLCPPNKFRRNRKQRRREGEKKRRREEEKKRRRGGVTVKGTDRLNEVRSRWTDAVGGTILYSIQVTLSESN